LPFQLQLQLTEGTLFCG